VDKYYDLAIEFLAIGGQAQARFAELLALIVFYPLEKTPMTAKVASVFMGLGKYTLR
jgi:hypothetical protein